MNREIKFRALDDGAMLYSHNNDFNHSNLQNEWFFKTIREDAIIMQYTGLKDKNGKEIYEGDIVKYLTSENCIRQIVWDNAAFHSRTLDYEKGSPTHPLYFRTIGQWSKIEVIGNIYEHPELINSLNMRKHYVPPLS